MTLLRLFEPRAEAGADAGAVTVAVLPELLEDVGAEADTDAGSGSRGTKEVGSIVG